MTEALRELIKFKDLFYMITWRDIRIKYKQSIMGLLWAVFMPLVIFAAGIMVKYIFSMLSHHPLTPSAVATISIKSIAWAFFVSSIRFSANSLIGNSNLVTKIYFPKVIFPVAATLSQLLDFLVAAVLVVVLLAILKIGVSLQLLWVPLLMGFLVLFTLGLGILLSAANLFFRDVKYLVEVILTFAIFFTPVLYEVRLFGKWANLMLLNPIAPILEGLNDCVVYRQAPQMEWILYSGFVSVAGVVAALAFFRNLEPLFAESI
jgi:lipopolysaccharide transport system permease protein